MASYEKRGNKWTVRFRIEYPDKTINKRLSGFGTKKEAEAAYYNIILLSQTEHSAKTLTLSELFELFKDYKLSRIKESSYLVLTQTIRDYVLPYFKNTNIADIKPSDLITWQNQISAKQLSYHTKNKIYINFVNLMNFAVDFYGLPMNPLSKVKNFKNTEIKKEMLFWTDTEFEQFISAVDDFVFKVFVCTLYLTGLRKGEALSLQWKDIDLKKAVLDINKTYTRKTVGGGYKLTTPKTQSSVRQIIIPSNLIELLQELRNYYENYEGFSQESFVFGMTAPVSTSDLDRKKEKYCNLAKVKNIRFHDFRHSHASLLINKEQNILIVAQRLGHSNIKMTLNTYSHLFPNQQKELMDSLNIKLKND